MTITTDLTDEDFGVGDIRFNPDGTKMFLLSQQKKDTFSAIYEYNLSKPFDVSTKSYTGDSERCILTNGGDDDLNTNTAFGLDFTDDGMKIFVGNGALSAGEDKDRVYRFDLTSPYDVSTCSFVNQTSNLDSTALQNDSNAKDREAIERKNVLRGIEISNDGTKLFVIFHEFGATPDQTRLLEYQLSTPFDLTTISLVLTAGIELQAQNENPKGLRFSPDGKRLWTVDHNDTATGKDITQISLDVAFSTASFTVDGVVSISANNPQPSGIAFSTNGLKMFVGGDDSREVEEYHLVCPFNIISGKCPPITENKDRTGIAMAQIEIAKRTIDQSTDTALNRLKWIRRNKDKQNLTNLNIDFNFTNQRLASLTEVVRTSAAKKKEKDKDEKRDIFYWSEGSVAIGRVGDTSISSTKEINTNRITVGADRFISEKALRGLAFSVGRNNVDVGNMGSNVDADTYNLTYYSTSPMKDDEKFVDKIFGIGKIHSDILTVLDGKELTANRRGKQIFGTIKIKDEIIKAGFAVSEEMVSKNNSLEPRDWDKLLDQKPLIIDMRNRFEYLLGTFKNSKSLDLLNFSDLKESLKKAKTIDTNRDVAIFCTGGIRCEKATLVLKEIGFNNIFQLKGGIINYLDQCKDKSKWQGECFVFDDRITY